MGRFDRGTYVLQKKSSSREEAEEQERDGDGDGDGEEAMGEVIAEAWILVQLREKRAVVGGACGGFVTKPWILGSRIRVTASSVLESSQES